MTWCNMNYHINGLHLFWEALYKDGLLIMARVMVIVLGNEHVEPSSISGGNHAFRFELILRASPPNIGQLLDKLDHLDIKRQILNSN